MIHVDSHVAVWLMMGKLDELTKAGRNLVDGQHVVISPIVELEVQVLHEIGRVTIPGSDLVDQLISALGASRSTNRLDQIVYEASRLDWTRDPFDRMITADAIAANCSLLTKDATIRANCELAVW